MFGTFFLDPWFKEAFWKSRGYSESCFCKVARTARNLTKRGLQDQLFLVLVTHKKYTHTHRFIWYDKLWLKLTFNARFSAHIWKRSLCFEKCAILRVYYFKHRCQSFNMQITSEYFLDMNFVELEKIRHMLLIIFSKHFQISHILIEVARRWK